jgi:PilZ domain
MTGTSDKKSPGDKVIARALKERRRFRRVRVVIPGRLYIPATQEEASCTIQDISPGDAALTCELSSEPKGRAVLYLEDLGRFEGPITRAKNDILVMTFTCSQQKREKLADQLTLEMNRHLFSEADLRRHNRTEATAGSYTHFTRSNGEQIRCEVLDLSLTGVSVRCEMRPSVGEHILIGNRAGRVARHHENGMGIEFLGQVHFDSRREATATQTIARTAAANKRALKVAAMGIATASTRR